MLGLIWIAVQPTVRARISSSLGTFFRPPYLNVCLRLWRQEAATTINGSKTFALLFWLGNAEQGEEWDGKSGVNTYCCVDLDCFALWIPSAWTSKASECLSIRWSRWWLPSDAILAGRSLYKTRQRSVLSAEMILWFSRQHYDIHCHTLQPTRATISYAWCMIVKICLLQNCTLL